MLHASHLFKHLLIIIALALATAACDSGPGPAGPTGPAGEDGADGQDGEDGNANVTAYVFDGHDFQTVATQSLEIAVNSPEGSQWDVYLRQESGCTGGPCLFKVPGYGSYNRTEYRVYLNFDADPFVLSVQRSDGPGEEYTGTYVFRTESSDVVDCTGGGCLQAQPGPSLDAVVEHYGLTEEDIIRL